MTDKTVSPFDQEAKDRFVDALQSLDTRIANEIGEYESRQVMRFREVMKEAPADKVRAIWTAISEELALPIWMKE